MEQAFYQWTQDKIGQLQQSLQRQIVVLEGSLSWQQLRVDTLLAKANSVLVCGQNSLQLPADSRLINHQQIRTALGTESDRLLLSLDDFNLDSFTALVGTVPAGGIILLLLAKNRQPQSQLVSWLMAQLKHSQVCDWLVEGEPLPTSKPLPAGINPSPLQSTSLAKTTQQAEAVAAILHVVKGHRNRPLVITADRGRGKSVALAIASLQIITQQAKHIVITSAHRNNVSAVFQFIANHLAIDPDTTEIKLADASIRFEPLDKVAAKLQQCDLLLVDEAGSVPIPILKQLQHCYSRIVFSTTVHGYEGAGRGFSLKFFPFLDQMAPGWQHLQLSTPIRWNENDVVERWLFDNLLVAAPLHQVADLTVENVSFSKVSGIDLLTQVDSLQQVFALLVSAHYQTKPSDLAFIIDNPKVSLYLGWHQQQLVAAAVLLQEGELDNEQVTLIKTNQRRLPGQFLPQALLTQLGCEQAFHYRYGRIMRIAVHPALQSQGIGSRLLRFIHLDSSKQQIDFLGTSFGANAELVHFWQQADFQVVKLGFSLDHVSGEHAALMLRPLSAPAQALHQALVQQFSQVLPFYLADEFSHLAPDLVKQLLIDQPSHSTDLCTLKEWVLRYLDGQCQYANCAPYLHAWGLQQVKGQQGPIPEIFIRRCLQRQSWQTIAQSMNFTGKKQTEQALKQALRLWLNADTH